MNLLQNIWQDIFNLSPISSLSIFILIAICLKSFLKQSEIPVFITSLLGLFLTLIFSLMFFDLRVSAFSDSMLVGGYANYFLILLSVVGILFVIQTIPHINKLQNYSEYLIVSLLSILGMMIMSASIDLVTIFLGLELMSISFYILSGFDRTNLKSNESALKYFLLGAFATGFLLYGISLIYGSTGTTNLLQITSAQNQSLRIPIYIVGYILILIGFGFKVAAVPFHMWAPDVYEGAPTTSVSLMATGGKISTFSAFMLLFSIPLANHNYSLTIVISILAASSMIVGNIFGLVQKNLKRMLAYSSIAHAGYMLIGIASGLPIGREGIAFYLISYSLTNLGAFGIIFMLESKIENVDYENISGLAKKEPLLAALMSIFMFSLIGLPPLAGFVGKYFLFLSAVNQNLIWLAVIGVLTSVVSLFYYLRIVVQMYFKESNFDFEINKNQIVMVSFVIIAAILVFLGLFPSNILKYTNSLM